MDIDDIFGMMGDMGNQARQILFEVREMSEDHRTTVMDELDDFKKFLHTERNNLWGKLGLTDEQMDALVEEYEDKVDRITDTVLQNVAECAENSEWDDIVYPDRLNAIMSENDDLIAWVKIALVGMAASDTVIRDMNESKTLPGHLFEKAGVMDRVDYIRTNLNQNLVNYATHINGNAVSQFVSRGIEKSYGQAAPPFINMKGMALQAALAVLDPGFDPADGDSF